uniref:Uncharacterized protein n=1 Tax=Oryza rufipogon TaxID=4529 RepID=A0A0E0R811_ORYRU
MELSGQPCYGRGLAGLLWPVGPGVTSPPILGQIIRTNLDRPSVRKFSPPHDFTAEDSTREDSAPSPPAAAETARLSSSLTTPRVLAGATPHCRRSSASLPDPPRPSSSLFGPFSAAGTDIDLSPRPSFFFPTAAVVLLTGFSSAPLPALRRVLAGAASVSCFSHSDQPPEPPPEPTSAPSPLPEPNSTSASDGAGVVCPSARPTASPISSSISARRIPSRLCNHDSGLASSVYHAPPPPRSTPMDLLSVMQSQSMEGTDASCHHSPTTAAGEALVQQSGGQTKKVRTVNFQSRGLPFSCKDHCDTIMSVDSVLACLASEALDLEKKLPCKCEDDTGGSDEFEVTASGRLQRGSKNTKTS